jgi:hypothetical protein
MCLGNWSWLGLVKDKDVYAATMLAEIEDDEEELEDGWDTIVSHFYAVFGHYCNFVVDMSFLQFLV